MIYSKQDLDTKYWPHVCPMMDNRGCHEWTAALSHGYGAIGIWDKIQKKTIPLKAHRVAWEIEYGPIPDLPGSHGGVIRHTCDNRSCVNPKHLRLGTQGDNVQDQIDRGTLHTPERSLLCRRGHLKEGKNLVIYMKRGREQTNCRICFNTAQLKRYHRNKSSVK